MSDNVTLKDLQNLLAEVAEAQRKTEAAQQKTEAAQQKTAAAIQDLTRESKKTEAAQQKTEAAQQKTAAAIQDLTRESKKTEAAQRKTAAAQQKTEAAQQKTEAAIQDLTREGRKTEAAQQKTEVVQRETRAEVKEIWQRMDQGAKSLHEEIKEAKNLFTGQWGKLMESLVEGDLVKMLKGKGIDVEITMQNIKKKRDDEQWEVDILALNGEDVVVVEVKTTLRVKDVKRFIERTLQNFTGIFPVYAGKRILGAVAYLRAEESAETHAEKKGLFAIRATGSSASIVNRENFEPRVF